MKETYINRAIYNKKKKKQKSRKKLTWFQVRSLEGGRAAAILLEKCLGCQSYVLSGKFRVVDLFCPIKC